MRPVWHCRIPLRFGRGLRRIARNHGRGAADFLCARAPQISWVLRKKSALPADFSRKEVAFDLNQSNFPRLLQCWPQANLVSEECDEALLSPLIGGASRDSRERPLGGHWLAQLRQDLSLSAWSHSTCVRTRRRRLFRFPTAEIIRPGCTIAAGLPTRFGCPRHSVPLGVFLPLHSRQR